MNFLSIFVLIPLLMLAGLWAARGIKAIRGVMVTGASALLIASVVLTFLYLGERSAGNTAEMLFRADTLWYAPLHISYSVGVDGISVAMLLLSAVIVFTGTFASWRLQPLTKEYFLWFTLLSMGVFGFFISVDLFTMFMFYEIALIPMYLLIGVWGSGRKEYAAMKLTLMLMGGSAFLLIGILGIYFGSGATTMNLLEIAQLHNIPFAQQCIWFPLTFLGFGVLGALFPFHTWSPDGHASAPTAVSMLHAGVLMKLGGYGCFRIAMYLMPEAAQELGWIFLILTGISGYRSYKRQQQLCIGHSNPASSTPYQQISPAPVNPYVALPGTSEHQSGLALDVSCPAVNHELITEFAETPEGKWLVRNASLYGFIIRYPANKESVTGIPWEPWHIRYVTRPLASCLALTGLTLEEYYTTFGAPLQNPETTVP